MSAKITFGKCPRCGVHDFLVEIPGLKAFCRTCRRRMIRLLEEADKRPLTADEVISILEDEAP